MVAVTLYNAAYNCGRYLNDGFIYVSVIVLKE